MKTLLFVALLSLAAQTSTRVAHALPPDGHARGFVEGANHHLGDSSFVARFGRAPTALDDEALRMRVHLEYVRALLGATPATDPSLEGRRKELLGYLDDYIDKGVTPRSLTLPWRNPVFVDPSGNVCAVGYLIERSVGRAIVEDIAAQHRFDFLEDIDMPEVVAWITSSGFTLRELASIQPGYMEPHLDTWNIWSPKHRHPPEGTWVSSFDGIATSGSWSQARMTGLWERRNPDQQLIGRGDFIKGRGNWVSLDAKGRELAEGLFVDNLPSGRWRIFHTSGRVLAEGKMAKGRRVGAWTFYYDADGAVPIAMGAFDRHGRVTGTWRHYAPEGALLATTWDIPTRMTDGVMRLRLVPREGLVHEVAQANLAGDFGRVDLLKYDGLHLYRRQGWQDSILYDGDGRRLSREPDGQWFQDLCKVERTLAKAAKSGALERFLMHGLGESDRPTPSCTERAPIDQRRAAAYDRMLALADTTRVPTPDFARRLKDNRELDGSEDNDDFHTLANDEGATETETTSEPVVFGLDANRDLGQFIASGMQWYIEWGHIDGAFERLFATLPSHLPQEASYDPSPPAPWGQL